jgi:Chromo (CHRromatin Organisation MOdifier) domain
MSRRHALRRAKVLRDEVHLASRFGLLNRFHWHAGDKAWWYRSPRTTSARDPLARDSFVRNVFAKKFQDLWNGPYTILQVGPSNVNGRILQANTLLLRVTPLGSNSATEQRVSMTQCKPCLDPTNLLTRPTGLPTGFAKYLLARCHHGATPSSLELGDATSSTERHGVESILNHRLRIPHRGATQLLEYRVRWEGDECAESWEPAAHLDACNETVDEYWRTLDSASPRLPHQDCPLISARLERVRSVRLSGVQPCICPLGRPYHLPDGVQVFTSL